MTEKKIYKKRPDIKEKVMERFPISKSEKNCKITKREMSNIRWREAVRLFEEIGKSEIQIK